MAQDLAAMRSLPERISFPDEELKILNLWESINAFHKSLELSKDRKPFTFYDGPPFATGLPHHGHILAGTIKDTVTRYAHQTGHYVERRFGWDCHGLPVENEINKKLGVSTKEQVFEMGIDKYNAECRSIVQRYTNEWERVVKRIGRWIDCENDYKTMEPWYMESVWNVFRTIFDKDLIYRGYKILPYSTACTTSLSNFEANLDYRDTPDPSVVVTFPLLDEPDVALLAWTTTPWTLPSNLALCVNESLDYVKIKDLKTNKMYVLGETRLCQVYPKMTKKGYKGGDFEILDKMKGSTLVGKKYVPLFECYQDWPNAFRVLGDNYVSDSNGTGIVHQAPTFGEDDYRVCVREGVTDKFTLPDPLDDNGIFTEIVPLVQGLYVKKADDVICQDLKARGRLVSKGTEVHSYPFCYRSGTPLIYRAIPGWFVNVERIRDRIVANNKLTYWVPSFVQEKRFHNWLVDGKDWNISRGRFWGTPLPLWVSDDYEEVVCVGSIAELETLTGEKVTDLHREFIDHLTIPSKKGKGILHRVPEVFDCWFESGSMPYAQQHYPFENQLKFEKTFPADFVAEGLDQTRGWFYTLMVLSTALFDKPAFQNLIVNGLVLAEDGRKMSKSLKNFTDPEEILQQYGADALRLYLINSPVVRAEPLKFQPLGVFGVIREIFLPWFNSARFFAQQATRLQLETGISFVPDRESALASTNVMDSWILAALHNLIKFVHEEMKAYRLYTVVPRLVNFIEQLTNWYVRLNRPRLKGSAGSTEAAIALSTLYEVEYNLAKLMAPFTPFFTEYMYQFLRQFHPNVVTSSGQDFAEDVDGVSLSIHFLMLPDFDARRVDNDVEVLMKNLQCVIEMGRIVRERRMISLKNPVKKVIVVSNQQETLDGLSRLQTYLHDELNMRDLEFSTDEKKWCVLKAETNSRVLGRRLGKALASVKTQVAQMTHDDVAAYLSSRCVTIDGHVLKGEDLIVKRDFQGDSTIFEANVSSEGNLMVIIDTREDEELKMQGCAREVITRVQKLRKKAGLVVQDKIHVFYQEQGSEKGPITTAIQTFQTMIASALGTTPVPLSLQPPYSVTIVSEEAQFADSSIMFVVARPAVFFASTDVLAKHESIISIEELKAYVSSMRFQDVQAALESIDGSLTVRTVKGETTLQGNVDVFLDAMALAKAL
ncbi:isoleucine-trna ligase [Plasmopara halstedii]|uniref:isoleucine--tRNA ligase n=1 Tax=Plasmopara halstedii TaxID=4781 RepID=A0A0P1ALS0_PLAHL|nr:isoleucine-trna ligase [Plasmopara halstedii]CEG41858.1 isoleucine-trna ligase [Plasmopara halstedii]|eukprot:XP_024578227.1 isoleucine-trna ligase [Plasmopara halstedii]